MCDIARMQPASVNTSHSLSDGVSRDTRNHIALKHVIDGINKPYGHVSQQANARQRGSERCTAVEHVHEEKRVNCRVLMRT
jgi:hypothetical protein